jgi:hypothetical protein
MDEDRDISYFLKEAEIRATHYDWLGAAEAYRKTLELVPNNDSLTMCSACEQRGYALFRAALQAENRDEFLDRIRLAQTDYESAKENYEPGELYGSGRYLRVESMISLMEFWLAVDPAARRKNLYDFKRLAWDALEGFRREGEALEYGRTFNDVLGLIYPIFADWIKPLEKYEDFFRTFLEQGEQAVKFLLATGDTRELARAYTLASAGWYISGLCYSRPEGRDERFRKAGDYWRNAKACSEEAALADLSRRRYARKIADVGEDPVVLMEKMLGYARKTRDRLVIGNGLSSLAYRVYEKASTTEDPIQRMELLQRSLNYHEQVESTFSPIPLFGDLPIIESWIMLWMIARCQTDTEKKRALLEKAKALAMDGNARYEDPMVLADGTWGTPFANDALNRILTSLAQTYVDLEEKRKLLSQALEGRRKLLTYWEKQDIWGSLEERGKNRIFLADILAGLADLAGNPEERSRLLREAVAFKESGCELYSELFTRDPKPDPVVLLLRANWTYDSGDLLVRLHETDSGTDYLERSSAAFLESAELFQKLSLPTRMAECQWKAAKAFDNLGDHARAAEYFVLASKNYEEAMKKIPQLGDFYRDQALYTEAWGQIERAKHHHLRREFSRAREHYERSAELHSTTKNWKYLSHNYAAWAILESAEDLSQRENTEGAIRAFASANDSFAEAKNSLQEQLGCITDSEEQLLVSRLVKASEVRRVYCTARMDLEEAKGLGRRGENHGSLAKYSSAADILEKLAQGSGSEHEKREFEFAEALSRAWQKMTKAETEEIPSLYLEASTLFEVAKNLSLDETTRRIVMGHSRLCKALEAGARFADTRVPALHGEAADHLESAANFYLKAGLSGASEVVNASKLLFDAYMYVDVANKERDQEKRAKIYAMAEKFLQRSAHSFRKADQPERRAHVLRLLRKVRKDRALAFSLTEILAAPAPVSATTAFPTLSSETEEAVGLRRFERANLQAIVAIQQKIFGVGESLDLKIQLVNSGKASAQIVRIEGAVPEGFEVRENVTGLKPEQNVWDLGGLGLEPLETKELVLPLRASTPGGHQVKTKVLYLDEDQGSLSLEPEPLTILVKEAGQVETGKIVRARVLVSSRELVSGESFEASLEITAVSAESITLGAVEGAVPPGFSPSSVRGGLLAVDGRIELRDLRLDPFRVHELSLVLTAGPKGSILFAPELVFRNGSGTLMREPFVPVELAVHPASPILNYLGKAFVQDYMGRRLAPDQAGWRTLMDLAGTLNIPKSQVYGDARHGHTFGRGIESLVKAGLVEYRFFAGTGRRGEVLKVRVSYEKEPVKRFVDELALRPLREVKTSPA